MNFSQVLQALNDASSFELFRLRAAINIALDDPSRLQAIRSRLQVGQMAEYFDGRENKLRKGQILEIRRKAVVLLDIEDQRRWIIDFVTINLDGADVQIRQQAAKGLSRQEIALGETLGFVDKNGQQRSGKVIRLNDKSAGLQVGQQQWRVGYSLLHRVMEVDVQEQAMREVLPHEDLVTIAQQEDH